MPNFDSPLEIDGLFVKIKPQSYFLANKSNQISFEENQTIRAMHDTNLTEETKSKMMEVHIAKLVDFGIDSLTNNTESITIDNECVTERSHIKEFYTKTNAITFKKIQKHIESLLKENEIKPFSLKCGSCENIYETTFTFDYANFFGSGF